MLYDFVIIGGGPAGVSAAIYAARFRLKTLLITKQYGGYIINTHLIENYPGFPSLSGYELMEKFKEHIDAFDIKVTDGEVEDIEKKGDIFILNAGKERYEAKAVLLATGTVHRELNVPGEKEFTGRGVSYCATCDAAFFRDKVVCVVGGSDSAAKEALLLSEYCKKVYIIYRREKIRAEPINAERVEKNDKIEIINNTNIVEIKGDQAVSSVVFDNGREFPVEGVFVEIGHIPLSDLAKKVGAELDSDNEVIVDRIGRTNIPGFYSAGDVTNHPHKQVIIAAAMGVSSAIDAYDYIGKLDVQK